ncbi:Ig-like domain-containing protein [Salmonella enterica]|nr:Ig-like domain-containing protein [Salmonella enterica]
MVGLTVTPADHTSIAPQVTADAAGKATVSLTSKLPGDKTVTATVTGSGNHRDQTVTFRADPSVTVKHLNISDGAGNTTTERPVGVTADSTFNLKATVLDGQGNVVAGIPVSWTLDQSACTDTSTTAKLDKTLTDTDAKGEATATLTSAGKHVTCDRLTITAAVPGTAALTGHVKYIAEAKSAMVTKNTVTSPYTDYLADGKAHADYRARVTDQYNNPVKGISVAWSGGKTAVFTTTGPVTTDDKGDATNSLTSTAVLQDVAPVATVNSALKGSTTATADRKVNFVANAGTATLSGITVTDDAGKTVDTLPVGTTAASVFHASATVVDSNGNPVSGQTVTWSLDQGACGTTAEAKLSTVTATTDSAGHSTATVASISPYHVCSGLKLSAAVGTAGHKTTPLNYIAEEASANVKTVALPGGAKTTYTADGKDTATWNATVADQYGNAVSGETVTWGGVTGAQPKYAAATTTTDTSGRTTNTMTSTTAATNVKATATVSSTTHTGTPVTASTPIAFTADASKATLTVTVTGSRQPTGTDTSHTAATADGADLLTLHFKAVDGNGNAVTSTPVHYTTAVTEVGIGQNTLACTTGNTGECTSTVKTTKAGTYNVETALVPTGAAQPVSPVKTILVFIAGQPDAAKTTASVDKTAANADKNETITLTLTPRDSHNNVVPLWTFRKELTITPSVNATVPGAVTVSTPKQDAAGNVTATLKYVETSGQLLSKEARTGTTKVRIGTMDVVEVETAFYPLVHVCISGLKDSQYVVPGTTKVRLCSGSGNALSTADYRGYTVTANGLSTTTACPVSGGGVCPSDDTGADFTGLTGEDVRALADHGLDYSVKDTYAGVELPAPQLPSVTLVYYGQLRTHKSATSLGDTFDVFHAGDAAAWCAKHNRDVAYGPDDYPPVSLVTGGSVTGGGTAIDPEVGSYFIGAIQHAYRTGGDTNPELFVAGYESTSHLVRETQNMGLSTEHKGALIPGQLVLLNGSRSAAVGYDIRDAGAIDQGSTWRHIGTNLHTKTNWNLSDMYYVNNWPGTPYTDHKGNGDSQYPYVTQVNYVTGYICAARLN